MIIGIDLGTTNSLVGVWRDGQHTLLPNALGELLTPSAVSIDDDGTVLVGRAARDRYVTNPDRTATAFKRHMGTDRAFQLGSRTFRAEELSALVLRSLREDAEAALGQPVSEAIITVPAYFNDTQRRATRAAGDLAGLKVERLLNEPTAAALAYGLHMGAAERRVLVFDLGGGTFDVSVLELFDGVIEIHASAGNNSLGGEDFTALLVQGFCDANRLRTTHLAAAQCGRLWAQGERAKRAFSANASPRMVLERGGEELEWTPTLEEFERLSEPLLRKLLQPMERALRDARLKLDQLDDVVLVGGASRMPMIPRLVAKMLGKLPLRHINPDEIVARGAAVQGGLKSRDAALRETVLTDVSPYTLGVETARHGPDGRLVHGLFQPIIERNTTIPASRAENFGPLENYQRVINLRVYQGESALVQENVFLGELPVPIPPAKLGEIEVEVRFTYDINGVLQVEARHLPNGAVREMIIEHNPGTLEPAEIARRFAALQELKIHPRERAENRAALERANRLHAEFTGDVRQHLAALVAGFLGVLNAQDLRRIDAARIELSKELDRLEGEFRL